LTSIVEYANGKPLNEILGISYKDSNGVIQHNPTATYPGATPEDASKILGTFLERGNFFDTANFYTRAHPEKIIGDFIAQDRARCE
jgi:aryl-alcohol dehydrogenase-like predicted oxidoreductase